MFLTIRKGPAVRNIVYPLFAQSASNISKGAYSPRSFTCNIRTSINYISEKTLRRNIVMCECALVM